MTYDDSTSWHQEHGYLQPGAAVSRHRLLTGVVAGLVVVLLIAAMVVGWLRVNDRLDRTQSQLRALRTQSLRSAEHLAQTQQRLATATTQLRTLEKRSGVLSQQLKQDEAKQRQIVAKLPADWQAIASTDLASVVQVGCDTADGEATGTAFAVSWPLPLPTGYATALLTNAHVIDGCGPGADGYAYVEKNNTVYDVEVAGQAPIDNEKAQDIALLYTKATLPSLKISSVPPSRGMQVAALGNPLAFDDVFTGPATVQKVWGDGWIQHGVTINHGSSGGPLIDQNGAVIGINTFGIDQDPNGDPVQGTYFAEPVGAACVFVTTASCPFSAG